ncbi:MAG: gamma-glutamyl-gamma-aminobutyrate hydrolase family protein [Syntrophales bacterium]|nr:gamma-glutamyl-gamma-aminobutyrate hydrolase family protein [Syntrophales bacterium]
MEERRPLIGLNMNLTPSDDDEEGELSVSFSYVKAVEGAGGIPLCLPVLESVRAIRLVVNLLDGFMFIGGNDYDPRHYGGRAQPPEELVDPRRDRFDVALMKYVLEETEMPILGICGGCQLLSIARGGALVQDVSRDWQLRNGPPLPHSERQREEEGSDEYRHDVHVAPESLLAEIVRTKDKGLISVNSFHHQAIDPTRSGRDLRICAWSEDGVVEAVDALPGTSLARNGRFILGVQWHPERMLNDPLQRLIFASFVKAAEAFSKR